LTFHNTLRRLRAAAEERQPGVPEAIRHVRRDDLRELLHHFDRLDAEARIGYPPHVKMVADAELPSDRCVAGSEPPAVSTGLGE
jgi:hypothetical protein